MAKRALKADKGLAGGRMLSVRIKDRYLNQISISMARRGMGKKGRSEWFRLALVSLAKMAADDKGGFLASLELYESTGGKGIQITLDGDSLAAFERLHALALKSPGSKAALITRLATMAAHLQLFDEGIATTFGHG